MALLLREAAKSYHYLFVELADPRSSNLPLMGSPLPVVVLISLYIYLVQNLGPRWMTHRTPVAVDRLMQWYNMLQIGLSVYCIYIALRWGWFMNYSFFCQPVDYSMDPEAIGMMHACYTFFLVKILDLADTVFFVLRKKNAQITFLHVYHHALMVAGVWFTVKYLPGGHDTFLGLINSMVHAVMYSYYLITSMYPQYKNNLWWKKHITQMQMVQFVLIIVHSAQLLWLPDCGYPLWTVALVVPQNTFMLVMFYDFYRRAYSNKTTVTSPQRQHVDNNNKQR